MNRAQFVVNMISECGRTYSYGSVSSLISDAGGMVTGKLVSFKDGSCMEWDYVGKPVRCGVEPVAYGEHAPVYVQGACSFYRSAF